MTNRSSLLLDIVYQKPGLHFSKIIDESGMKNGVLAHYSQKLESEGKIRIEREKNRSYYFSPEINIEEIPLIIFLRKPTSKKILLLLHKQDGLKFREIVNKVQKSAPTISQNLTKLMNSGLITLKIIESEKKYFIKKK